MMSEMSVQDFEIIATEHPDYIERMEAIDSITDFKILEEIFITDEYITVRCKALDRLTELYEYKTKFKEMLNLWHEIDGFKDWIHFTIENLGKGNNIEKTIRYILRQRGYPFEDFWNIWYPVSKTRNKIFQKVIDVILKPIIPSKDSTYYYYTDKETGIEIRSTDYGIQYHYEMVIKILQENDEHELYHEYVYIKCWNTHNNVHERFYKKINYT